MRINSLIKIISVAILGLLMAACSSKPTAPNEIRVGTIAGPETTLMEVAKQVAKEKYDLDVQIVTFTDYALPNAALNDGDIDANMFQTIPYLNADSKAHGYQFKIIGKTFIYPMAIYSQKIKSIKNVPQQATVVIPNDPSNEARALLLLQKAGLIELNAGANELATLNDIKRNPKNLNIKTLDAAELTRALPDVTLAVINTNFAVPAGLFPTKDGLFLEDKNSPYANVIVAKASDADQPKFQKLVAALHSEDVIDAAKSLFQDQAIPAWDTKAKN